jgi:hypothetical protein
MATSMMTHAMSMPCPCPEKCHAHGQTKEVLGDKQITVGVNIIIGPVPKHDAHT